MNDSQPWFLEEDPEILAQRAFQHVRDIDDELVDRSQLILDTSQAYGDSIAFASNAALLRDKPELTYNVLAGAVDTVVSEVIQTHRRPVIMSRGGEFRDRFKCKKLTQWLDILRKDNRDAIAHAARDGVLCGLGIVMVTPGDTGPRIERLWPGNLRCDDRSCIDTVPRTIWISRYVDKYVLCHRYPEKKEEILKTHVNTAYAWTLPHSNTDLIEVVTGIHLPSGHGAGDGKFVVCIENCTLEESEWDKEYYPMVFIRPVPPQIGFWGESIALRALPAQEELNKLLLRVQEAMHLISMPRVYIKRGAGGIPKAIIRNNIGAIIVTDDPPTFHTPQAMNGEVFEQIDRLERFIYAAIGASQMAAQSIKPIGIDSGAGLRAMADVQSRRFIQLEESVANATMDLAKLCILTMKEMVAENSSLDVVFGNYKGIVKCSWSDINLEENAYKIGLSNSNALPVEFSGRIQMLSEMMKSGSMDSYDLWSTIDNPDFEAIRDRYCAPKEIIEMQLDSILETGEYIPPEPDMALENVGIPLCVQRIQQAKLHGATSDDIEPLRLWLTQAQEILGTIAEEQMKKQAEATEAAKMQMAQQGPPMLPPGMGPPPGPPSPFMPPPPMGAPNLPPPTGPNQMPPVPRN